MKHLIFTPQSFGYTSHSNGADIALLLHTILYKYITDSRYEWGDGVYLRTDYLQNFISSRILKNVFTYCEDNGFIDIDKHYVVGGRCRRYSLGAAFTNETMVPLETEDFRLCSRLDKLETFKRSERTKNFRTIDRYIMNAVETRTDYSRLLELSPENLIYFATCRPKRERGKEKDVDIKIERMKMLCEYISRREHNGIKDKNGRLYNTVTYLQKEMRPLLTLDGQNIIFQDISHTHPVLLFVLLNNQTHKNYSNPIQINQIKVHNSLMKCSIREDEVRHELEKYQHMVESATLYHEIAKDLGVEIGVAKVQLLSFFFDKPRLIENCKYTKWFANSFPYIHDFILESKQQDYRFLGNFLQQVEVDVVLNRVCHELMLQYPGIPLLTIHDAIGTTEPYTQIVNSKLKTEFKRLGICPQIKEQ